jgi:DNA-binding transcriptional ArsR family regulator
MTGLTAKSSTEELVLSSWGSAPLLEQLVLQLADAFARLARTRLTTKQRKLLLATRTALGHRPTHSLSALADHLSRNLQMPLSTVKFNLAVLRRAGLLQSRCLPKRGNTVTLSAAAQLLARLLQEV